MHETEPDWDLERAEQIADWMRRVLAPTWRLAAGLRPGAAETRAAIARFEWEAETPEVRKGLIRAIAGAMRESTFRLLEEVVLTPGSLTSAAWREAGYAVTVLVWSAVRSEFSGSDATQDEVFEAAWARVSPVVTELQTRAALDLGLDLLMDREGVGY